MKLAEALILRADYQKRIAQLKDRLIRNAMVQEGDAPSEDPRILLDELEKVSTDLTDIIQRINRTNSATELLDGQTISDALAVRDVLQIRSRIYRDLAAAGSVVLNRYGTSEIRSISTVDVTAIQKRADELAKEYRELDAVIQHANWNKDLLE